MDTKTCTKCGIEKPVSEFGKQRRKLASGEVKPALSAWCRPCNRSYIKEYREANPEKARETARKSHAKHREKRKAAFREYYAKNAESAREYARGWRKDNREQKRAQGQAWHARNRAAANAASRARYEANADVERAKARERARANPERIREYSATRKATKKQRTPAWADRVQIGYIYAIAVRVSRETGIEHHVDHIVPLQGELVSGLHCEANLQVIPARENLRKKNSFEV